MWVQWTFNGARTRHNFCIKTLRDFYLLMMLDWCKYEEVLGEVRSSLVRYKNIVLLLTFTYLYVTVNTKWKTTENLSRSVFAEYNVFVVII